ncbi:winged helix-turn-helix transcriptional regulator [Deinococcus aetherius]|nr:helix-turn-helix domain-containing protein [Deinococcus aetherius]
MTEQAADVLSRHCPSQGVLEMVTGKWSVLVLYALRAGTLRYSELEQAVDGISQKMLTQTLRDLERNGLVARTAYPVVPPRTEYRLTDLGASLEGIVTDLGRWAQNNMGAVLVARQDYDGRRGGQAQAR